jgi:hypothetical protein
MSRTNRLRHAWAPGKIVADELPPHRAHARNTDGTFRDGAAKTTNGSDACPPKEFRATAATRPLRHADKAFAHDALRTADPDDLPVVPKIRMPFFT